MTQLKRLLDEPGSDLDRVLLEAGLDDEPPKAALDRTLLALGVGSATAIGAGALGASGASLGGAKASGLFGAGIVKWVGGAVFAGAVMGGGFLIKQRATEPAVSVAAQQAASPAADRSGADGSGADGSGADGSGADRGGADRSQAQDARAIAAARPTLDESEPARGVTSPRAEAQKHQTAPIETSVATDPKTTQPEKSGPAKQKSEPATQKPSKAEAGKPDMTAGGGSLSDELKMLDVARRASLAGDSDACLASLSKYKSKFPKGQLAADADAMRASCAAKKSATTP